MPDKSRGMHLEIDPAEINAAEINPAAQSGQTFLLQPRNNILTHSSGVTLSVGHFSDEVPSDALPLDEAPLAE